jgi:hypothetical protein
MAGGEIGACAACLRRAHLVAALAPRIAGLLDRPSRPGRALLALDDEELVAAVAGANALDPTRAFDARRAAKAARPPV